MLVCVCVYHIVPSIIIVIFHSLPLSIIAAAAALGSTSRRCHFPTLAIAVHMHTTQIGAHKLLMYEILK